MVREPDGRGRRGHMPAEGQAEGFSQPVGVGQSVEAGTQPVFVLDRELRYTAFNRAHAEVMRALYGAEITLGGCLPDFQSTAADRETARVNLERALAGERVVVGAYSGEPGRERRYFDVEHAPQTDSAGAVVGVEVRAYDVTDRRRFEIELGQSEARYVALFANMPDGFAYCRMIDDDDGRPDDFVYVTVNPAFTKLTGLRDVIGKRATEVIPTIKDETPELLDTYGRVARTGEPTDFEIEFTPLGLWLHVSAFRPEPGHFAAVFSDITERRRAEAGLRESERRLSDITFSMADWVWEVDESGVYTYSSQKSFDFFGPSRGDVIGKTPFDFMPADEAERVGALLADIVTKKAPIVDLENWIVNARGERFCLLTNGVPMVDDAGELKGYRGVNKDITERRRAEEALRRSEAMLTTAESVAWLGSWRWDLRTQRVDWSEGMFRLFAADPADFDGDASRVLSERVHPDDLAAVQKATATVRESGEPVPVEYRLLLPDGGERIVHGEGTTERDARGRPEAIVGYYQDVTVLRQTERQLLESVRQHRDITDGVIAALARSVEVRDPYTAGHERRVSELTVAIARQLGLDEEHVRWVQIAARLHDVGKIVVPAEILAKPGRLSATEFQLIQAHSQAGCDILAPIAFDFPLADIVLQHHERLDGSGYPRGLRGDSILREARILAVADVVEAMSSHRPYRATLGMKTALAEVREHAGVKYDADVVASCVYLVEEQGFQFTS
jgi:PAS domain S-box-containing protein